MIRRRVKVVGHDAVRLCRAQHGIGYFQLVAAKFYELFKRSGQDFRSWGGHPHSQVRKILVGPAEVKTDDFKLRAALNHPIEDLRKDLRIDEVPLGFNNFSVQLSCPCFPVWIWLLISILCMVQVCSTPLCASK